MFPKLNENALILEENVLYIFIANYLQFADGICTLNKPAQKAQERGFA